MKSTLNICLSLITLRNTPTSVTFRPTELVGYFLIHTSDVTASSVPRCWCAGSLFHIESVGLPWKFE